MTHPGKRLRLVLFPNCGLPGLLPSSCVCYPKGCDSMYAAAVFAYVPCCAHVFETCLPYSVGGGRTPFRGPHLSSFTSPVIASEFVVRLLTLES
jgi:hypothetical protein